jgi:hypothetical protein
MTSHQSNPRRPTTGQLRELFSRSHSINPYELYIGAQVERIGSYIQITTARELVDLRRQLRDAAASCIRYRDEHARGKPPSAREDWLDRSLLIPTKKLRHSIETLSDPKAGYWQDLQHTRPKAESPQVMQRFLRRLDAQLRKLEEMTETARNDLNTAGQRLSNSSYFDYLVEVFSGVYLQYMPASSVGLNKRYPENSPYMQFIRKSAKPLIGHEHGLVEQMKNYRDKLKS